MKLTLIEEKVQQTIRKNTATSYGLTLVIGLPFPPEISTRIQSIQQQLETLVPGRFTWYGLEHLHATLVAPLRGRYRDFPPLQREELPTHLQGFTQNLANFFAHYPPFSLELAGVYIASDGLVMVSENILVRQLASSLHRYPELDQPKHLKGLQVTIGFFNSDHPLTTDEQWASLEATLPQFIEMPIGSINVQHIWLVHYANRTLNRITGKVVFTLGQVNVLSGERLLQELGITDT